MDGSNLPTLSSSPLVKKALKLATKAHKGQLRKDGTEPYINHPIRVAAMIEKELNSNLTTAAALLHDVVEDTPYTIEYIEQEFGHDVKTLVWYLTEDDKSVRYEQRKNDALEKLRYAPPKAQYIKLSDQIDNMQSIIRSATHTKNPWHILKHGKQSKIDQWEQAYTLFSKSLPSCNLIKHYRKNLDQLIKISD